MNREEAYGVVDQAGSGRRTDYLFRISIKGLVRNDRGEVLVVKEAGRMYWDLPGGGVDHGESIKQAIAREMREEVQLEGDFSCRIIAVDESKFLQHVRVWQTRLVFEVVPINMTFKAGDDGDEVAFMDPQQLKGSDDRIEQKVYEYAQLAHG